MFLSSVSQTETKDPTTKDGTTSGPLNAEEGWVGVGVQVDGVGGRGHKDSRFRVSRRNVFMS